MCSLYFYLQSFISTHFTFLDICAAAACSSSFWTEVEPYFAHVTSDELSFLHKEVNLYFSAHPYCSFSTLPCFYPSEMFMLSRL